MNTLRTAFLLVSLLVSAAGLRAQEAATWTAKALSETVAPGQTVKVAVTAKMNDKWHIYSVTPMSEGPVATSIEFAKGGPLARVGKIAQPPPIKKFDEAFGIETEYFEKQVTFTLTAKAKADAKPGPATVTLEVTSMGCNDRMCLPPSTKKVSFPITIGGEGAALTPGGAEETAPGAGETAETAAPASGTKESTVQPAQEGTTLASGDEKDVARARKEGFWAYIGLAMSVGALALLTPCVFPMIPITVSFFTKREQATRARAVRDALIYSFGIIFTFTGLGIVLALTLGASGINQFAASPWMNLLIAAVFIAFALNLFGLFEIIVPSSVLTKLTVASGSGQGIASILLMGLTFTLTSFTCTVPFVGTVMVAASSGEIWWSVVGMLAFSSVFALPFFLLALFPSWLKSMPKSGGWLNSVKVVMGFLELAAAMKFLSNVDLIWSIGILSRDLFLSFWVGIGVFVSAYLLGLFQLPHDTKPERIGVVRMLWSVFFFGMSIYLYTGLGGRPLGELDAFMPPVQYQEAIQAASGGNVAISEPAAAPGAATAEKWYANYEEALAVAKREGKPVFIDFTGFACTNCRWMESNVFPRPDVKNLFGSFVLVRLYTDGSGPQYDRNRAFQQERFGTIALPLYVTMSSDDQLLQTFPGLTRRPEEFVRFLESSVKKSAS